MILCPACGAVISKEHESDNTAYCIKCNAYVVADNLDS